MKIFVVDDEDVVRNSLSKVLTKAGHSVKLFANGEDALADFKKEKPELVILDLKLPNKNGLDVLKEIKKTAPTVEVIMVSAFPLIDRAVEAVKSGAADYMIKPFNLADVRLTVSRIEETIRLRGQILHIKEEQRRQFFSQHLIGLDAETNNVYRMAGQVATHESFKILITGEPGVGKEMLARFIHYKSSKGDGPFVTVNCSAIPKELVESALFGYEPGTFGSKRKERKPGYLEDANNGTVFFDEIADLEPAVQVKLLQFLQDYMITEPGSEKLTRLSLNVIGSTNAEVEQIIEQGKFRKDLYFNLNIVRLALPPLRDRGDDVIIFSKYFVEGFNRKMGRRIERITDAAAAKLKSFDWPGNLRELKNVIERAYLLAEGPELDAEHILIMPIEKSAPPQPQVSFITKLEETPMTMKEMNRRYAQTILRRMGGNKSEAARILGISRNRLKRILMGSE